MTVKLSLAHFCEIGVPYILVQRHLGMVGSTPLRDTRYSFTGPCKNDLTHDELSTLNCHYNHFFTSQRNWNIYLFVTCLSHHCFKNYRITQIIWGIYTALCIWLNLRNVCPFVLKCVCPWCYLPKFSFSLGWLRSVRLILVQI